MFSRSKLQSIVCTSRISEAEVFYRDVPGLNLKARSDGALVFDVGGADLRVSPVPSTAPTEHTVLGFAVPNVYGVLVTPDGSRVAWFRDPDGNLLSVVQFTGAK